ncbi:MAG: hypothetical protein GY926_02510 [bacterium]|nr:hypothetical protein [bacterium]MCP4964087.1 hypothetical protein [bacterium]
MTERSEQLLDFALFALDHATNSVVPHGGPLIPFCFVEVDGKRELHRFAGDLEQGQRMARAHIAQTAGVTVAAVAWDGYMTLDGHRMDAVYVEASESGGDGSLVLAQRYAKVGRLKKKFEPFGQPALVAEGEALF